MTLEGLRRVVRAPGMEFQFPRGWQLQRDGNEESWTLKEQESWTLKVYTFRLYVSMKRDERDAAKVIERFRRLFTGERRNYKIIRNDRSLRLAGHKVEGMTAYRSQSIVGTVRTSYALRTGPDTVLFRFSESREGDLPGEPSTEWKEMERWLQESLKVLPASGDK